MDKQLLDLIKQAGVVGAGGAGFPTHAKLNCEPEYVIANCAECEPLIKSDKHLMEMYAADIVAGMETALKITGAKEGVIAVKHKNKNAVANLEIALSGKKNIRLHLLENYYPAGDEQQIIYEVTKRVVKVGQIPISAGCVVINGQTLYHVAQAVQGKPVISRMVTVNGAVNNPITVEAPIGTPVTYLIEKAGGVNISDYVVVLGGPLMGRVSDNVANEFVTKTTNGILVLPKDNELIGLKTMDLNQQLQIAKSACCNCSMCTMICPRNNLGLGVQPHKVMQALTLNNSDLIVDPNVALGCCNCGLCTYVGCNMGLTPGRFVAQVRGALLAKKVKATKDPGRVNLFRDEAKAPSHRVIQRMGLTKYDIDVPYAELDQPRAVRVMLKQHIGAPCSPLVGNGDMVTAGQMVGNVAEGALGAPVHASISGKVVAVTGEYVDIMKA
ncbi:MAG: SLBB domain-containing protein [Lachnospiraceae bacterium]|jgi:Na+-translocating ferredoxin:NAD+ oxidoreductase RnfC subunit